MALLTSNVEEQVQLQRKLQEESLVAQEQYEALKDEFEKLKELLNVAEAAIQREKQISVDLAEEVRQLNRVLQDAEQKCADLNSGSEALARKDSDERLQLQEERRALADRCNELEEQISQFEVSFRKGKQNESMLLQEIQDLKEEYRNNIEVFSQVSNDSISCLCFCGPSIVIQAFAVLVLYCFGFCKLTIPSRTEVFYAFINFYNVCSE